MAYSTRTIGIIVASIIAVAFVVIAVLISGPLPFHFLRADAGSTHDLLVSYASKDTDADGLPDWEEALYGTDPANPHSVNASVTDGDAVSQGLIQPRFANATTTPVDTASIPGGNAVPGTVTDQFARALFSQYLAQHNGTTPTPGEIANFVEQAVAELTASEKNSDAYSQAQVRVVGSGPDALLTYAAQAEGAFAAHTVQLPKSEVDYLSDAVEKNDATALKQIAKIGAAYGAIAKAYVSIPVPSEAAVPHLAAANALARISVDIDDMAAMQDDPLRGYFGLANYEKDVPVLQSALKALGSVYKTEQVSVPAGTTGSSFYGMLMRVAPQP